MDFGYIQIDTGITIPTEPAPAPLLSHTTFEFTEPVTSMNLSGYTSMEPGIDQDGNTVEVTGGGGKLTFSAPVTKISLLITGDLTVSFDTKLKSVVSIGTACKGTSMSFQGCNNLVGVPAYLPPNVTNMSRMFFNCKSFNQDLSGWDVSNVTNMSGMFGSCKSFNQDISSWDVSNVTTMKNMFDSCTSFNQDLSSWNLVGKTVGIFDYNTPSWTLPKPIGI